MGDSLGAFVCALGAPLRGAAIILRSCAELGLAVGARPLACAVN